MLQHPGTGQTLTWLMEELGAEGRQKEWDVGCVLCRSAGQATAFGMCTVRSARMVQANKLARHEACAGHQSALKRWREKHGFALAGSLSKTDEEDAPASSN